MSEPLDAGAIIDTLESLFGALEDVTSRLEALEGGATYSAGEIDEYDVDPDAGEGESLEEWVEWLQLTYRLEESQLTFKWRDVPGAQQELAALHAAWRTAYDERTRQPHTAFDAMQWHDGLQRVLGRIQEVWHKEHKTRSVRRGGGAPQPHLEQIRLGASD